MSRLAMSPGGGRRRLVLFAISFALISLVNVVYVYPNFRDFYHADKEDAANIVAGYIASRFRNPGAALDDPEFITAMRIKADSLKVQFGLLKISVLDPRGEAVFSTDPEDVGKSDPKSFFCR